MPSKNNITTAFLLSYLCFSFSMLSAQNNNENNELNLDSSLCPRGDCSQFTHIVYNEVVLDSLGKKPKFKKEDDTNEGTTLYTNCIFPKGVGLAGQTDVYFYNCLFETGSVNLGLAKNSGTWTNDSGNNNLTFDSCEFRDAKSDSFVSSKDRNKTDTTDFNHTNISIINSHFENWGAGFPGNKLYHAIYSKASNLLVENCTFKNIDGGSAISMRNTGIVRGNHIQRENYGMASIEYWNQFYIEPDDSTNQLLIENNVVIEPAYSEWVHQLSDSANGSSAGNIWIAGSIDEDNFAKDIVPSIIVRYNTVVTLGDNENDSYSGIKIKEIYSKEFKEANEIDTEIEVYANLMVDLRSNTSVNSISHFISTKDTATISTANWMLNNYYTTSTEDFIDPENLDFHLGCGNDARLFFVDRTFDWPDTDKDGLPRRDVNGFTDVGAYEFQDEDTFSGLQGIRVKNQESQNLLTIEGVENYDQVLQHEWENWTSQYWKVIELCNGIYAIGNKKSRKYMLLDANANNIKQHEWEDWTSQKFNIINQYDEYFSIEDTKINSDQSVTISGTSNWSHVVKMDYNAWSTQLWEFIPISELNQTNARLENQTDLSEILDVSNSNKIKAFPNPSSNFVNLKFYSEKELVSSIEIWDIHGKKQFSSSYLIEEGENLVGLELANLKPGLYFISIPSINQQISFIRN